LWFHNLLRKNSRPNALRDYGRCAQPRKWKMQESSSRMCIRTNSPGETAPGLKVLAIPNLMQMIQDPRVEIRSPNSVVRKKAEIRNPKSAGTDFGGIYHPSRGQLRGRGSFGFRPSDFFRISVLGSRIWTPIFRPRISEVPLPHTPRLV
jgi:hypothetical protein